MIRPASSSVTGLLRRCVIGIGMLLLVYGSIASAQYPRTERGRFEVRGLDFRPQGAWRVRTGAIRAERRAILRRGAIAQLNARPAAAAPRATGSYALPVLLVQPSNVTTPFVPAQYQSLLFDQIVAGRPYTLRSFYAQLSNGQLHLGGTVFGWWTAPQPNTYYEDGCHGIGAFAPCQHATRMGELLTGALEHFDAGGLNWGQFDNDGPDGVPNSGDDDGIVDFVTFVHPDVDGACGTAHLWSHRWRISAWTGGSPFTTRVPRTGRTGEFIRVEDYILTSGVGGGSGCSTGDLMPISTIAHETGHAFGLPDLYDTDGSASRSEGIGAWGLMGSGGLQAPNSPARMEAWSLVELGWVTVDTLGSSRNVAIGPVATSDTVLYIPVPGRDEYFLIENRQALESDTALLNPQRTGGLLPGLLVWHIDNNKVRTAGLAAGNTVNSGSVHGVALVQADGLDDLRRPGSRNRGDSGDPYPGASGNRKLSWQSLPAAADNTGQFAGFMLDQITQVVPGGAMAFRFTRRERSLITAAASEAMLSINGRSTPHFEDVLVPGDEVTVTAPLTFTSTDARSRFAFTGWSNGATASFTLIPRAEAPETLVAGYAAAHRIRVMMGGTGSIASSPPDVTAEGSYVTAGTTVLLDAIPAAGAAFLGWSGDISAGQPTLELIANRPYDLIADFTVSSAMLAVADAVTAVLTGAPLAIELTRGLDAAGNRNGSYDVGDLLAYLDRVGPDADPALIQRLLRMKR